MSRQIFELFPCTVISIDRCIFNLKPEYLDYLRIYEKNLKERNKILKDLSEKNLFYIEGKNIEKD